MSVLAWLLGMLAAIVLLPVLLLVVQVLMACLPARAQPMGNTARPQVAVLVPAHDEASIIGATLASIAPQLRPGDRLLVVADNCTDDTAQLAREAGAEVVERHDARLRGKGYALDFGVRHLTNQPPEVVIVVDADCQVGEGQSSAWRGATEVARPVQALYLMYAPAGWADSAGCRVRLAGQEPGAPAWLGAAGPAMPVDGRRHGIRLA